MLYDDGTKELKIKLQKKDIYIPTWWKSIFSLYDKNDTEYCLAENILQFPIDQRCNLQDMKYIVDSVIKVL